MDQMTGTIEAPPVAADQADGWTWMVVEIFGHRKHVGRVREVEQFGAKLLRVDVPIDGDPQKGWRTHMYGGASIFGLTPTDEESAMRANKPYEPPSRYRLPAPSSSYDHDEPGDDDHDEADDDEIIEQPPAPAGGLTGTELSAAEAGPDPASSPPPAAPRDPDEMPF